MIHALIARNKWLLMQLQRKTLSYFLDNQLEHGLILDRQANHGPLRVDGLCSTSATGMGLIALALASTPEYSMLTRRDASRRVRKALETALVLPHDHGIMPHFTTADGRTPVGTDRLATIDSAWLIAGGLLAAQLPWMHDCRKKANELYERADWRFWTIASRFADLLNQKGDMNDTIRSRASEDWLLHGEREDGTFLPSHWDLMNAETAFMYVLATGGKRKRGLRPVIWDNLKSFHDRQGAKISRELGLFVHQYSIELINFSKIPLPGGMSMQATCRRGVERNYLCSRRQGLRFKTFRRFWGISAGDGPPNTPGRPDEYRAYAPLEPASIDGTAHVLSSVASVRLVPELVLLNMLEAESLPSATGRYGYSNINLDRNWFSRDVVGIDAGAAMMALDNAMHHNRIPSMFHEVPAVKRAIERMTRSLQTCRCCAG